MLLKLLRLPGIGIGRWIIKQVRDQSVGREHHAIVYLPQSLRPHREVRAFAVWNLGDQRRVRVGRELRFL
jgi:hypothetical protein